MEYAMNDPTPVTNADLMERLDILERKTDIIFIRMEQATGAWTFVKILGSIVLGMAVLWNTVASFFKP